MSSQSSRSQQRSERQRDLPECSDVTPIQTRNTAKSTARSEKEPKFNDLELVEKRIISRIEKMESEFLAKVKELVNSYESKVNSLTERVMVLEAENVKMSEEIKSLQCVQRSSDIVVRGIPVISDENPNTIFENICSKIGHSLSPYSNIFRVKPKSRGQYVQGRSSQSPPIIVKFSCANERRSFLYKFHKFGPLGLDSLGCGFVTGSRVSCFESVSSEVNLLLREAISLKKRGKLLSVHAKDGAVYVRAHRAQPFLRVKGTHQLRALDTGNLPSGDSLKEQSET